MSAEQRPYLVMDYLPGGTLAERLTRDGPISWQEAADVGVKLAGAPGAAHAAGVLHRDVKPDNVLMSAYGEPQLFDFGIARLVGGIQPHRRGHRHARARCPRDPRRAARQRGLRRLFARLDALRATQRPRAVRALDG